jgi:hypothetical protein
MGAFRETSEKVPCSCSRGRSLAAPVEKLDGERFALLTELRRREALARSLERGEGSRERSGAELGPGASKERRFFFEATRSELRFRSWKARDRRRARRFLARRVAGCEP